MEVQCKASENVIVTLSLSDEKLNIKLSNKEGQFTLIQLTEEATNEARMLLAEKVIRSAKIRGKPKKEDKRAENKRLWAEARRLAGNTREAGKIYEKLKNNNI